MKLGIATGVAFVAAACLPASAVSVPTGPGTDLPCGVHGKTCSTDSGGGCCDEQEICGHDHSSADEDPTDTCPAGSCCYVGPDEDEAPPSLMMHRQAPRR